MVGLPGNGRAPTVLLGTCLGPGDSRTAAPWQACWKPLEEPIATCPIDIQLREVVGWISRKHCSQILVK